MDKKVLKISIIVIIIIALIAGSFIIYKILTRPVIYYAPGDHNVTRSFDKNIVLPNEEVTVTLTVDTFDGNDNVYTIEERFPPGITIVNPGDGTISGNKLKWVIFNQNGTPVADATHTYVISALDYDNYTISGKYAFNSEKPAQDIYGETVFQVVGCIPSPEVCDGIDNDCDGNIDNGFDGDECEFACNLQGYNWTNNGGTLNCCGDDMFEGNPFQANEFSPINFCADGNDNDCDGQIDVIDGDCFVCTAGVDVQNCTKQDGVCLGSQETCNMQGQWDGCGDVIYLTHNSSYEANEATCDGLDNDCDANTDENPDLLCEYLGEFTCISGNCECNSLYEEDTSLFVGNCDGCVSPQELSFYIYEWKINDNPEITQEELTSSIDNYLNGASVC